MEVDDMQFQQDCATCHTSNETFCMSDLRIWLCPRRGYLNWPHRSCDFIPLDFFIWGFLKSKISANKPQTTNVLKVTIGSGVCNPDNLNSLSAFRSVLEIFPKVSLVSWNHFGLNTNCQILADSSLEFLKGNQNARMQNPADLVTNQWICHAAGKKHSHS